MIDLPFAIDAGQPLLDRVVERQLFLGDELKHDNRDERLCDASDAEAVARPSSASSA